MSDAVLHSHDTPPAPARPARGPLDLGRLAKPAGLLGFVGTIAAVVFMFAGGEAGHHFYGSWMFGWVFWLTVSLGMLGLTLLHHTVRGAWTLSILRLTEAGGSLVTFLALGALFLPVLFNMPALYEWTHADVVAKDAILQWKSPFLNMSPLGFPLRFVIYFGLWGALAWGFRNSTQRQERSGDFKLETGRQSWGAASLVAFVLSMTFAMTDFVMSMEPHWSSTMYGPWTMIMGVGAALALCIGILTTQADREPYRSIVFPGMLKDLGNMQFAFTMLWGYTTISQFLIIWNGNLPETTQYFVKRSSQMHPPGMETNHWGALGLLLILGRFFIPFFILLAPRTKKTPENLRKIVGWIFVMHLFDVYLLVVPATHGRAALGPIQPGIVTDLIAWAIIGCVWVAAFASTVGKTGLLPSYDDRLLEAKKHAH